jgi:hypothetical protein
MITKPSTAVTFLVTMAVPSGADVEDLREYVQTEVMAGCGARDPRDPIFDLDRESVTVSLYGRMQKSGTGLKR